jgi:hypothetical protein
MVKATRLIKVEHKDGRKPITDKDFSTITLDFPFGNKGIYTKPFDDDKTEGRGSTIYPFVVKQQLRPDRYKASGYRVAVYQGAVVL